jgi:hypothetical protein
MKLEAKQLLRQLWDLQANQNEGSKPACRFQLQTEGGPVEYLVCGTSVLLDYAPAATIEPGKLFTVNHLPLKKLQDASRVNPEVFLSEESVVINQDTYLSDYFLPLNNKEREQGLGVFEISDNKAVLKNILPYLKDGSFQFAGLSLFHIHEELQMEINKNSSMKALNARISKVRTNASLAVVLSCDTAMLIVMLARVTNNKEVNENIYMDKECTERYKLDGYRDDQGVFSRLVKVKKDMVKGLPNPVRAKQAAQESQAPVPATPAPEQTPATPAPQAEPQVEEVKPEQAAEIAAQAPEAPKAETAPAEEPKKRTRAKRPTITASIETVKGVDELIAYLGSPIPDGMTTEAMQEEVRKLRDLGVVVARRQSNLYTAATTAEKKLRDTLRSVLG